VAGVTLSSMRRKNSPVAIVVVTVAVAVAGAACGASSDKDGASVIATELPTTDNPEGTGLDARLEGRLEGSADSGCVWLVPTEEGWPRARIATVWPKGFTAQWEPLRLMRDDGEVIASEGDVLVTGGGLVPTLPPVPPLREPCRTGDRVWVVSQAAEDG
jgi:hypothetical protein